MTPYMLLSPFRRGNCRSLVRRALKLQALRYYRPYQEAALMPIQEIYCHAAICDCCGVVGPIAEDAVRATTEAELVGWGTDGYVRCPPCLESGAVPEAIRSVVYTLLAGVPRES